MAVGQQLRLDDDQARGSRAETGHGRDGQPGPAGVPQQPGVERLH